jgi:hypothetical protein
VCREKVKNPVTSGIMPAGFPGENMPPPEEPVLRGNTYLLVITHHVSIPTELGELEIIPIIMMILTRTQ